jgi:signal transduction histidine kinase
MSLRLRLILLIVALVALVAVTLSALHLDTLLRSLSDDAAKQSELASQQVSSFLSDHVNQHYKDRATPSTMQETRTVWRDIVATDPDIATMLEKMMALSHSLVEINVADENRTVLVSSNPQRAGTPLAKLESLSDLAKRPLNRRLLDLTIRQPDDYEVTVPIGNLGQSEPLFTVQVVSSGVFLRDALRPDVERLAAVSGAVLAVSLLLTLLATQTILRPLRHIEQTIDRIVQGNYGGAQTRGAMAKEFAVVETKLDLLGEKFRGARQDASELRSNIGQLLERMATQIDIGARLAAISRLTGGVAHEIKNPLNAIALRLDLLRARLEVPEEELAPKELVKDIDILSKEVLRLDRVVKTFLDFSRPVEVHFLKLDLAELAREVCLLLTPQAKVAHVEVVLEAPEEPALMRGDADMLRQVILNLVTNAIDAMKDGGKIVVKVFQEPQAVFMDISDTGSGIDPKLRDRVFQLYFTTKTHGSGIGLAMTFRAVQMHNGTIDFASETGKGTTFHIEFPALDVHG